MAHLDGLNLPASIADIAEMMPVEDLMLAIMRDELPDLPLYSLIPFDVSDLDFFGLVRRAPVIGAWRGDMRFIDTADVVFHVFTRDPNADEKGAVISEAIRVTLRNAVAKQKVYPELGYLKHVRMRTEPARKTDWNTSSGPVQFADLPNGFFRYETQFSLVIRRPI